MKVLTCLIPAIAVVSRTQLNLTIDSMGRWRMPIATRDAVHTLAYLYLEVNHGFSRFPVHGNDLRQDHSTSQLFTIQSEHGPESHRMALVSGSIGAAFNSAFSRMFHNYIIAPTARESSTLVLNPEIPEQFARRWFYVNTSSPIFPQVMASV